MQGREIKFECIYRPTKEKFVPAKIDFVNRDVYGDFDGEKYARCYYSTEPDGYGDAWLRQFTGLHDKNGKEIYEGDIGTKDGVLYQVIWVECGAMYGLKVIKTDHVLTRGLTFPLQQYAIEGTMECNFEVIGNIYENPELLEVGK